MIIKYLTELLYDNECVIVADFGAFITQIHSAVIDYTNNRFTPPYKEIIFNNKLVADDGLLVDFISKKENITKEEATEKEKTPEIENAIEDNKIANTLLNPKTEDNIILFVGVILFAFIGLCNLKK